MSSFYGYNVIGNEASAREHLRRLQPRALLYMDAGSAANWAAQTLQDCKVIHRVYTREEDVMHRTPGATLAYLQARASERLDSRVYINLSCEPALAGDDDLRRLVDEQLAAMRWAQTVGVRVAGPHFAHYGLVERHWPIVEPLTTFIAQNADLFLFTVDEYFAGHAFSGVVDPSLADGNEVGHIQPETWRASPVPHYYHKGRVTNLLRWLKANGKPLPPTVITEDGADALGDVTAWRNSLIKALGYTDIRGWRSLEAQWRAWYGLRGWSPQRAYLEMLVAFWREVYADWPNILGSCLYCWGTNNDRQWDQFRLDETDAQEFRDRLEATSFSVGVPPVTTPAEVHPPEDKGTPVRATINEAYNVRSGPGVAFARKGTLAAGSEVTYYPATAKPDIDTTKAPRQWVVIEQGSVTGWIAIENQFTPIVVFGEPTVQHPVPFQTQRNTGPNNCGPAALTSLLNYWLDVTGRPGQVMIEDVINAVGNAGSYATLNQLKQASAELGLDLDIRTNLNMAFLRAELDANRPFVVLVDRADLPGVQDFYAFDGSHYTVVTGYGDGFITLHDPLSLPGGAGVHFKVADAAFLKAWETTPGNSGRYQALVAPPAEWEPVVPPAEEPEPEPEPEPPVNDDLTPLLVELGKAQLEAHRRRMLYEAAQADWFEATARVDALTLQLVALSQETLHVVERNAA